MEKVKEKGNNKLSFLLHIIVGGVIGFIGAIYSIVSNIELDIIFLDVGIILIFCLIAFFLHLILHEGGHLIFGLLSNYEFVSFRVGSFTLVKDNNKFVIKKFKIPGTGGQCLMMPKVNNYEDCPYILYNLGGVIMNILASVFCFILYKIVPPNKLFDTFLLCSTMIGIFSAILNGIPMKISGIANDGYNLRSILKDNLAKYCFYTQLKINGLLYKGINFKNMDKKCFEIDDNADFSNPLVTAIKTWESNYYACNKDFQKAKKCCEFLLNYKPNIVKLFENELKCDLLFYEIIIGEDKNKINNLFAELKPYIKATNCFIARKRLLYAYALLFEKDLPKAEKLSCEFKKAIKTYPVKGEISAEVEMMDYILDIYKNKVSS